MLWYISKRARTLCSRSFPFSFPPLATPATRWHRSPKPERFRATAATTSLRRRRPSCPTHNGNRRFASKASPITSITFELGIPRVCQPNRARAVPEAGNGEPRSPDLSEVVWMITQRVPYGRQSVLRSNDERGRPDRFIPCIKDPRTSFYYIHTKAVVFGRSIHVVGTCPKWFRR